MNIEIKKSVKPVNYFKAINLLEARLQQLYEKKERQQMIRQQVNNLPDNQKLSLILITYQELSYQEVSTIIGCSVSAVKSLVHRARQSLKRKLIELGVEESHNAKI